MHLGWCFPDAAALHLPAGRAAPAGAWLRLPIPRGAWYPSEDAAQPRQEKTRVVTRINTPPRKAQRPLSTPGPGEDWATLREGQGSGTL